METTLSIVIPAWPVFEEDAPEDADPINDGDRVVLRTVDVGGQACIEFSVVADGADRRVAVEFGEAKMAFRLIEQVP